MRLRRGRASRCRAAPALAVLLAAACADPGSTRQATAGTVRGTERARSGPVPQAADGARAELREPAPDFTLADLDGRAHTLSALRGRIVVLVWFDPRSAHCEFAFARGPLREQPARHAGQGVAWLAVNSSGPGQPGADPEANRAFAREHALTLPILLDRDGIVGRAYAARTTPHCFVINERGRLVYQGALDNAPLGRLEPGAVPVNYVDAAIADLRSGHALGTARIRPYGERVRY